MQKSELIQVEGTEKDRERIKITLVEVVKNDMSIKEATEKMTLDMIEWRK